MPSTVRRRAALTALARALRGSSGGPGVGVRLGAVPRMLSQGLSGRYPHLDTTRVLLAGAALLYILSPVDLVPEAILPLVGLGDDALVAAWLAGAVLSEADTFLDWERSSGAETAGRAGAAGRRATGTVIPGDVVE